jgi:23S rRNA pseudouridine2605 synthase
VRRLASDELEITVHEGRKRQVKRMCAAVGHPVRRLERVAFGSLKLGELAVGRYRLLTGEEVETLTESRPGKVAAARDPRYTKAKGA